MLWIQNRECQAWPSSSAVSTLEGHWWIVLGFKRGWGSTRLLSNVGWSGGYILEGGRSVCFDYLQCWVEKMWVRSVAKRVCLLWTNGVACHICKQRMLGPSSHQPLQPHTPNKLCTLRGFRTERNRILALRVEVFIRVISMIARLLHLPLQKMWKWKSLSRVRLFVTPSTMQSMEFSRPEYWSG